MCSAWSGIYCLEWFFSLIFSFVALFLINSLIYLFLSFFSSSIFVYEKKFSAENMDFHFLCSDCNQGVYFSRENKINNKQKYDKFFECFIISFFHIISHPMRMENHSLFEVIVPFFSFFFFVPFAIFGSHANFWHFDY